MFYGIKKRLLVLFTSNSIFILSASLSLLSVINILIFGFSIIFSNKTIQTQYIPDDGFYYLVLARNFNTYLQWTFDSGNSITSGFHPLTAYMYAILYRLTQPTVNNFPQYSILLGIGITFLLSIYIWLIAIKRKKYYWLAALSILTSSKFFIFSSISLMEWPLVVLTAALFMLTYQDANKDNFIREAWFIFILGVIGSLSRTDFFVLPIALLLVHVLFYRFKWNYRILISVFGFLGSIFGFVLTLFHNYLFTGEFIQSSAKIKFLWSKFFFGNTASISLILGSLGSIWMILFLLGLFPILIFIFFTKIYGYRSNLQIIKDEKSFIIFMAAIITLLGYVSLYSFNGAVSLWYTANFTIPVFILLVGSFWFFSTLFKTHHAIANYILLFFTFIQVLLNFKLIYPISSEKAPWKDQILLLNAVDYINENKIKDRIGAFNSGILGYYLYGTVINLDGLVNNDIYNYLITNNIPTYVKQKKIKYICDYKAIFENSNYSKSRGVDTEFFIKKAKLQKKIETNYFSNKDYGSVYIFKLMY